MNTLYPLCRKGHELTPKNVRREYPRSNGFRLVVRCRACDRERKHKAYTENSAMRARAIAYSHWFRFGHPTGKSWDEIKAELQ
ncbi:hypothetical protein ACRQ5Q_14575 [Bradyrhizobium sp. PMVTL-01]|uniref:hypothetical protein n=1 Tax=Bradyrhizobium sp. PMVTL-01 TaxID=3434999 RepID=UPI003F6EF808